MKENTNKNELLNKWFEFKSEEIETNLSEEDRKYMFSFQDIIDELLKVVPYDKQDWIIKLIDEYDDKHCECYLYWAKKYYIQGWRDLKNLLNA